MLLTPLAILAGVLVGLARGGKLPNASQLGLQWWALIAAGLVAQTISDQRVMSGGTTVLVVGSFLLILGLVRNLHLKGMTIVSIGMLLNLTVLAFNGHVPTRFEALVSVGKVDETVSPDAIDRIGAVGQVETSTTKLAFLGDIVPLPILNDVISFGDLILMAGLFVLSMNLLLIKRRGGVSIDELLGAPDPYAVLGIEGSANASLAGHSNNQSIEQGNDRGDYVDPGTFIDLSDPDIDLNEQVWAQEESTARPSSEDELLAPFPYPDSSTR